MDIPSLKELRETYAIMVRKKFEKPMVKIVMLNETDIIATSTGATGDDIPMNGRVRNWEDEEDDEED